MHYNGGTEDLSAESEPSQDFPEKLFEPVEHKFELEEGQRLVHDERGVRLVSDHEEESD